eukprot:SAG11_NODE_5869_length_1444_cov_16.843866_2_plen_203_part_01
MIVLIINFNFCCSSQVSLPPHIVEIALDIAKEIDMTEEVMMRYIRECPVLLGEVGGEDGHEGDIESYKEAVKDWVSVQILGSSESTRELMPEMRGDLRGRLQGSPSNRVVIMESDSDDEIVGNQIVVDVTECGAVRYKDEYYKNVQLHLQKLFPKAEVDSDGEIDINWDDFYSEDDLSPTKKSVKDITPERLERELARGLTPD